MATKTTIVNLSQAIIDIIGEYEAEVLEATDNGLDAAQDLLIENLQRKSPKSTGKYARSWVGEKSGKLRFVGNTKKVEGGTKKRGGGKKAKVALSDVLEYSYKSNYQGQIKKTYNDSVPEMAKTIVDKIKEV